MTGGYFGSLEHVFLDVVFGPCAVQWDDEFGQQYEPIYIAHLRFLERLLSDWAVRTEDPYEANLFYVPAFT